jgi:hypothetical protein
MLSVVIIIQKKDENVNGSWQFCGSFFDLRRYSEKISERAEKGGKNRSPLPTPSFFGYF